MKITLFMSSLSGGGAERVVCNLANYLVHKGHSVTMLLISAEKSYEINAGVRCITLKKTSDGKLLHALLNVLRLMRMNQYLRREKQDVYVTFLPKLSSILLSQRAFIKAPVILAERCEPKTYCESSKKNASNFLKYYPRADAYVFQTEDARRYYQSVGIDTSQSIVIPNAINSDFIGKVYSGPRTKRIVSAGRLDSQKNFALLINAFAQLYEKMPEYKLEIYGEGNLREKLQAQIDSLGLGKMVSLPGRTNNIIEAIRDASLFVLPSDFEGMPNALAEAMALGLPCISTDCPAGGSRFLIKDGVNGLLVPVGDVDAMAQAMEKVLSDTEYAAKLGQRAQQVCDALPPKKIYKQWETFISGVCGAKK